jgi:hypothetical protein
MCLIYNEIFCTTIYVNVFSMSFSTYNLYGSKLHVTNQCVYFAFRTIDLFGVLFPKKHIILKRNFQIKCIEFFKYFIYNFHNMSYVFLQSNLEKYEFLKVHKFCKILCFILKICHSFKSYQNMLTLSSFIFYVINYKFSLNNIYIASHLHVEKDS